MIVAVANSTEQLTLHRLPILRELRRRGFEVLALGPQGDVDALSAHQIEFRSIPLRRRSLNPAEELRAMNAIRLVYRKERPQLAYHITLKPIAYGQLAANATGVPASVNNFAGLGYAFTGSWRDRPLVRLGALLPLRIGLLNSRQICLFENAADREVIANLCELKPEQTRLVNGVGVDTALFSPSKEPDGMPIVLLPARLLADKGVREFVAAAQILAKQGVEARFVLVGGLDPGNPSSIPQTEIQGWVAKGIVEWWGRRNDMPEVYRQASVVCLPSYREGLSVSLMEAAACGRPLVAADVPGCREICRQNESGVLVPARDAGSLAGELQSLLADGPRRRRLGANARKLVKREFDGKNVCRRIADILEAALHSE